MIYFSLLAIKNKCLFPRVVTLQSRSKMFKNIFSLKNSESINIVHFQSLTAENTSSTSL